MAMRRGGTLTSSRLPDFAHQIEVRDAYGTWSEPVLRRVYDIMATTGSITLADDEL